MQALIFIEAHGKIATWSRISAGLGMTSEIVATGGHMCRFPDSLYPLGIRISRGQAIDTTRTPRQSVEHRIRQALRSRGDETEILIATDDDAEGDVIALDVIRVIVDEDPLLIERCLRVRPRAITRDNVARAIEEARAGHGGLDDLVSRAVAGRTRALTDRWMGATFSRMARAGCGRVRAGILGSALCWEKSPDLARELPETGEITLQARSGAGGLPFTARIGLHGQVPEALAAVARRYAGRLVPGHVNPMRSAGAAVAPRFENIAPFNTGDAIAYAGRFHGVGPKAAMAGLQSAYMNGRISYPRTDNRTLSEAAAAQVTQAARACNLRDVDMAHADRHRHVPRQDGRTTHEAIYPTPRMTRDALEHFRDLVRRPAPRVGTRTDDEVEDLMVMLVARRAFEALRPSGRAPGVFHPRPDSDLSTEERAALQDLDWFRPDGPAVPWGRSSTTGLRIWPMSSVMVDGMMIEEIGRPSTWASHADQIEQSGQLEVPSPGALPRPTPAGRRILKALPRGIWSPAACRMIEETMSRQAPSEDVGTDITQRMRARIDTWFAAITPEVRTALVEQLKSEADGRSRAPSEVVSAVRPEDVDPTLSAISEETPEPALPEMSG